VYTGFWWGNLSERDHLGDPGVDVKIKLRWSLGSGMWGMGWIDLAQDADRRRALVNGAMNLQVPYNWGGGFLV
jgi:hypothetical protein